MFSVGHAKTFLEAFERYLKYAQQGIPSDLILRIEDLDYQRCKSKFVQDIIEDLHWIGISWTIGPDKYIPQSIRQPIECLQSKRLSIYHRYWMKLLHKNAIYPCSKSRKDVERALQAPHEGETEIVFPTSLRPLYMQSNPWQLPLDMMQLQEPINCNWRFRVPDDRLIDFFDEHKGPQSFRANVDFGDFIVWRFDVEKGFGYPSYDFACAVDDIDMEVSEIVRGEDLLLSTARQILLYEAFDLLIEDYPSFFHCDLVRDENGKRLAKRSDSKSIQSLRVGGISVDDMKKLFNCA